MQVIKIGIVYGQTMGLLGDLNIPWPRIITLIFSGQGSVSASLASCVVETSFYTRFQAVALAPAACAVLLLADPLARCTRGPRPSHNGSATASRFRGRCHTHWTVYRTAVTVSLFVLYPFVATVVVSMLDCSPSMDGVSYVEADYREVRRGICGTTAVPAEG